MAPQIGDTQKCETCFAGVNTAYYDEFFDAVEWSRCGSCNARALAQFQLADLRILDIADGQALIGACLGSRKTGTTAAFVNRHRGVWVGVVPLHTMNQWRDAIHEWSPGTEVHMIKAGSKTGLGDLKASAPDAVHLIGWELMRRIDWRLFKNLDGAFLDEVHRMAGFDTLTAKAVHRINSRWRIPLSGTPAQNALWKLWNVLHWVWWGNNDHKTALRLMRYKVRMLFSDGTPGWLPRHFHLWEREIPGVPRPKLEIGNEKVFHSVIDEVPVYIQHLEEEKCCEFHPKGVNATLPPVDEPETIYVDMTTKQGKLYEQISGERLDEEGKPLVSPVLWLEKDGQQAPMFIGEEGLVTRIRLRQIALAEVSLVDNLDGNNLPIYDSEGRPSQSVVMAEDAKSSVCDAWLDLAQDIVEPGDPVLVFTHSKQFAKMVVARTNKRFGAGFAVEWSGDVKQADRDFYKVTMGLNGGPQVIVAVIASIAEGTDGLQLLCRREVWLSWDESLTLNTQAEGRLRRTGQRRRNQRWDIVARGTINESMMKVLRLRRRKLSASLKK